MTSQTTPTSHSLPCELRLAIIEQANPSTLAILGRVSSEFLEVSAPLEYKFIEITSIQQLERLFCERSQIEPSRITPHLSLSQTQTIFLNFLSPCFIPIRSSDTPLRLSFTRLGSQDPLPLTLLRLSANSETSPFGSLHTSLFHRLNPLHFILDIHKPTLLRSPLIRQGGITSLVSWTRLETFELAGVFPMVFGESRTGTPRGPEGYLAHLPRPTRGRKRVVKIRLATLFYGQRSTPSAWLSTLLTEHVRQILGLEEMQEGTLVLVVRSEEEKRATEEVLLGAGDKDRAKFAVEVETDEDATRYTAQPPPDFDFPPSDAE